MTKLKFCGLKRTEDIKYVNELKPDFIGFVFAPKSKRFVDADTAKELKNLLDSNIKAVGVFVDEPVSNIERLFDEGIYRNLCSDNCYMVPSDIQSSSGTCSKSTGQYPG